MKDQLELVHTSELLGYRFTLRLTADRLKLYLGALPLEGNSHRISRTDVLKVIWELSPAAPVNLRVIDDILPHLNKPEAVLERLIATGTAAQPGSAGKLVLLVTPFSEELLCSSGAREAAKARLFDSISKGQTVARIYAPRPGEPGRDALGREIPPTVGAALKVEVDDSIIVQHSQHSYQNILAARDGVLIHQGNSLKIDSELRVRCNVDARTGNIDFIGSVKIFGDVRPGFEVLARGDISVLGSVEGGSLSSARGSISVAKFVSGGSSAQIVAGGSFEAPVVHGAEINAEGEIRIGKEVTESLLKSVSSFNSENASVIGGKLKIGAASKCKILGNAAGKVTEVYFAGPLKGDGDPNQLQADLAAHDQAIQLLELHLGPYANRPQDIAILDDPHRLKMTQLLGKLERVRASRQLIVKRNTRDLAEDGSEGKSGLQQISLSVQQSIHEGVIFNTDQTQWSLTEAQPGPVTVSYSLAEQKFFTVL